MNSDKPNNIAWYIIIIVISIAIGYAWSHSQKGLDYEAGYIEGIAESATYARGEICTD